MKVIIKLDLDDEEYAKILHFCDEKHIKILGAAEIVED